MAAANGQISGEMAVGQSLADVCFSVNVQASVLLPNTPSTPLYTAHTCLVPSVLYSSPRHNAAWVGHRVWGCLAMRWLFNACGTVSLAPMSLSHTLSHTHTHSLSLSLSLSRSLSHTHTHSLSFSLWQAQAELLVGVGSLEEHRLKEMEARLEGYLEGGEESALCGFALGLVTLPPNNPATIIWDNFPRIPRRLDPCSRPHTSNPVSHDSLRPTECVRDS